MPEHEKHVTIEELKAKAETPDAVFEGVKAANKWKPGKMVTERAYKEAVKAFEKAPMDGREVRRNV